MTFLLCLLLKPALYGVWALQGGPKKYLLCLPITIIAWLIDVWVAHIEWPLIAGFPHIGEVTVSDTLERLCKKPSEDINLFIQIALKINRVDPLHSHIKAVRI